MTKAKKTKTPFPSLGGELGASPLQDRPPSPQRDGPPSTMTAPEEITTPFDKKVPVKPDGTYSWGIDANPSTSHADQVQKDMETLSKEIALEEEETIDPVGSFIKDIGNEMPDFPTNVLEIISKTIKDKFENAGGRTLFTATLGISLATSIFSILKDIYVACVSTTAGAMTLCIIGIVASLVGVASQIAALCQMHQVNFDLNASVSHIYDQIRPHLSGQEPCGDVTTWDRFKAWIPRTMTFVATLVAAGLSFLPRGSAINTLISSYGNSKKIGEDVSSMMSSFLTDVVGVSLEGDPEYVESLVRLNKEGVALLTTPMHQFHIDTKLRAKLTSYPQRVDEATLHRTNNDTFKTLKMTLQSLQATRNQVVQRIQELNDSSQRVLRQEPVGIFLAGMGGIGKSFFAKEIAKALAKECNYSDDIYCIDKCGENFYEPYKGEAVGIANEFMSRRAENEPLLQDINKICSEDYFNFEGASLHTKNQPCHLKVVVLTSNVANPSFVKVQEPSVTEAMWSRFMRFEVKDKRFANAEAARKNPQKLPRSSTYLEFLEFTTKNENRHDIKTWTAEEVIQYVVTTCRRKELVFLKKMVEDNPYNLSKNELDAVSKKAAVLEGLIPCAKDGRVFTVRLEGPPGTGKTYFLEKRLVPLIMSSFPSLVLHRWGINSPVPDDGRFYMVVVDDTLDDNEKAYMEMVSKLSNRSILVIGTNTETRPVRTWTSATIGRIPVFGSPFDWAPAVEVDPIPGVPNGFWRRIGIADRVRINGVDYEPYSSDVAHFRFEHGYIIRKNGKQLAFETAEEEILEKYIAYLQDAGDFIWSDRRLNITDPTVKIIARSYTDMIEVLSGSKSKMDLIQCFARSGSNNPDPRMQIFLNEKFMKVVFDRAGVEEWRVPDRPVTGTTRLHVAEKISSFLRKFKPDATVVVNITEPGIDDGGESTEPHLYELKGSMGYYTLASLSIPKAQVTYDQNGVRVHATNEILSYDEVVMVQQEHNLPREFKPATLRVIKQSNLDDPRVSHARMVYNRKFNLIQEMASLRVKTFFSHPATIACMSIMGALSLSGIIYGIYAACRRSCDRGVVPCDESPDSRSTNTREAARAALRQGNQAGKRMTYEDHVKQIRSQVQTQKDIDELDALWDFSRLSPYQEEIKGCSPELQRVLLDLSKAADLHPSTVTPELEIKPHYDPRLAKLMDKITRNLVTVSGHGTNYGLMFEGDILVTTGHTVAGLENVRVVSKEFRGTAKVIKTMVPRDIAVLQLIRTDCGRRPPQFPSLRKHMLANLAHLDQLAWFVKPFSSNTVFVCGKMLSTPSYKCFSAHLSETFNPSEWIITFFQHHMPWSPTLFQKGECGLPLFIEVNGEFKICGIFNAANHARHVTFASVTASDFNNITGSVPMTQKICDLVEYKSAEAGVPYFMANSFVIECFDSIAYGSVTHVDAGYPEPIGHCVKLRSHSYPKHKSRALVPNNISAPGGLENTQRLSCINEVLSPDIELPRRSRFENGVRVPHTKEPLFLQIQKYAKAPGFTGDPAILTQAIDQVIHSYRLRLGITKTNPLGVLSIKECLNGVRGGALGGFPRDTGAGPTLRSKFNIVEKRDVLYKVGEDLPVYVLAENASGTWVRNSVCEKMNALMNGIPVVLLTKACKKVEKIDVESWQKAKVRLFTECDFEDNIVLKMLFGDLQNKLASTPGCPVLLNLNPYTMAGQVAHLMGHDLSGLVGTDISSMDKHFPPEMIIAFVRVCGALYQWLPKVQRAVACTLMFPLQNFEGDVFTTKGGNLSGWFPTSLMNCVAQEIMIAYDRIKNFAAAPLPFDILKSGAEPYALLGDDKIQRLSPTRALAQEKSYLECGFVMQAGSKLQAHEERFCSRSIYKEGTVYYGALKLSAISGLIYYASSSELEAILPNFSLALFEAALHEDPVVYDRAFVSIQYVAKYNDMELEQLASRERYREIYEQYCTGLSTILDFCGHRPDIFSVLERCKMGDNARMALNQYAQQLKQAPPSWRAEQTGPAHSPSWTVDLSFMGQSYTGTGESKSSASEKAAQIALQKLSVQPKMETPCDLITVRVEYETTFEPVLNEYHLDVARVEHGLKTPIGKIYRRTRSAANRAAKNPGFEQLLDILIEEHLVHVSRIGGRVCVWYDSDLNLRLKDCLEGGTRYKIDEAGMKYVVSAVMQRCNYTKVIGALEAAGCLGLPDEHRVIYVPAEGPCTGPDTPIQPENIQQAALNTGALTIPQMANPQPSGQAPSMAPPAEKVVSAMEAISTETLNPLGPPNMLAVGAVVFDIKDLIYTQFLDCDQQFVITDDTPPGAVLLQIPYDPLGEWVNPYIRQYVGQHERFTGSLLFRITIVGNPTFSGLIGVAWQPRRINTPTVNISEMQKFSYYGVTVELPSNKVIVLNDARQELFWRSTMDTGDIANRPHLVLFTMMSLISPLREGIQTRIRIASKLANGGLDDGIGRNAFQVSLPTTSSLPSVVSRAALSQSTRLADLVPGFNGITVNLCTDGMAFSGRGDSLRQELVSYSGATDQSKLFRRDAAPNGDFTYSADDTITQRVLTDSQTFNFCGIIQDPAVVQPGGTRQVTQNCYAVYETNNLPATVYRAVRSKVFADFAESGTVSSIVEHYLELLQDPTTYEGLGLLGIYYSPEQNAFMEYDVPQSMVYNQSWPISAPGSQTRYGYMLNTNRTGTFYGIKIVMKEGVMVFYVVSTTATVTAGTSFPTGPVANSIGVVDNHQCAANPMWATCTPLPRFSHFPPWTVEAEAAPVDAELLPAGWAKISITPVTPSVVIPTIFTPTLLSSADLEKALARRAVGLAPSQCLAFDIVDPISNRRICSARYLQETGDIVCNIASPTQNTIYAAYPGNVSEALLSNFGPIERSNAFVITDTSFWLSRKSTTVLSHFGKTAPHSLIPRNRLLNGVFGKFEVPDSIPCAAMAAMAIGGGALSGIGGGLSSMANRKHELKMQKNMFQHQTGMLGQMHGNNMERDSQGHAFNLERDSQSHMFELERMLENFGYTNQLQAQQFQHESSMSKQNFQQKQAMAFASAPSRTLLGGSTRGTSFA